MAIASILRQRWRACCWCGVRSPSASRSTSWRKYYERANAASPPVVRCARSRHRSSRASKSDCANWPRCAKSCAPHSPTGTRASRRRRRASARACSNHSQFRSARATKTALPPHGAGGRKEKGQREMRKIKLLLGLLALVVVATVAIPTRAQKQSGASAAQNKGAGVAQRDETTHPDCPLKMESKSHPDCPLMRGDKSSAAVDAGGHEGHVAAVNERGEKAMGFSKSEIRYEYEETGGGALVRIKTQNAEALAAIQDFLRFQITDHQTGDSLEVNRQ